MLARFDHHMVSCNSVLFVRQYRVGQNGQERMERDRLSRDRMGHDSLGEDRMGRDRKGREWVGRERMV